MTAVDRAAPSLFDVVDRRSSTSRLVAPAPDATQLGQILDAAVAAPDHGRVQPWRFILLPEAVHEEVGRCLEAALVERRATTGRPPTDAELAKERTKLGRAPLVVVVAAARHVSSPIPWEEQQAAVAAAVTHMLLAATALGFGSMWRTGPAAADPTVKRALGLQPDDAIVGFVYLGTIAGDTERPRPARPTHHEVTRTWSS